MNYTTVTKLARNPRKEFEWAMFKTVLHNNKDIWMVLSKEMADALQDSWILEQIINDYIKNKKQSEMNRAYENMWKDKEYLCEMLENTKYLGNL